MYTITLNHGPYEVNGVIKHWTKRLDKLKFFLEKLGFVVELNKIQNLDRLCIDIQGIEIFRCRHTFLMHHDTRKWDTLLEFILLTVVEARSRIRVAEDYYYFNEEKIKILN